VIELTNGPGLARGLALTKGETDMPTKLKVPEGCGGVSHAGVSYTPDENGIIEVEDGVDLAPLFDHGLTSAPVEAKKNDGGEKALDDMTKAELLAKAEALGLEAVKASMNKVEIIAAITEAVEAKKNDGAGE
jgi:hypothetical protein